MVKGKNIPKLVNIIIINDSNFFFLTSDITFRKINLQFIDPTL